MKTNLTVKKELAHMVQKLDTIYIELIVQAVNFNDIHMQGDIEIRIGNTKPYNEGDVVMFTALEESMKSNGEFFIFSCCCGLPECSGWTKGIQVTHHNNTAQWIDSNNNNTWIFDKARMIEDLEEIRKEVIEFKKFFKQKDIEYVGVGYDW